MSQVTSPVILDSTGQDIVTQLAAISAGLAAGNVITVNTDTTLSGVLQGANGKVAVIPVDASPTEDSTNLVSSGGVKAALDGKAAKADLTNIQATGTTNTTGAVIPAGAYFYLNGILHQAKTQIDVNATFTVNTNCEQVTDGGLNAVVKTRTVNNPVSPTSGVTLDRNIARISGNVVSLTLYISANTTLTVNGMLIGYISSDLVPAENYEVSFDVFNYSTGAPLGGAVWLTRSNRRVDYYGPAISANAQKVLRIVYLKE